MAPCLSIIVPEDSIEPLVLRVALKEFGLPVEDGRVIYDVPSEGEVCADLGMLRI